MQRQRGERIERNFGHQFDTEGMDRLWVRGRENVRKTFLIQAATCNLALLLRSRMAQASRERPMTGLPRQLILLVVMKTVEDLFESSSAVFHSQDYVFRLADVCLLGPAPAENGGV